MFYNADDFNQDIGDWDVSNVTVASADSLNQDRLMFTNAINFNQDIGDWDVSNVTDMRYMFYNAQNFNQDLTEWCITNTNQPIYFQNNLTFSYHPVWGTCP